jgi:hypothetical protein
MYTLLVRKDYTSDNVEEARPDALLSAALEEAVVDVVE